MQRRIEIRRQADVQGHNIYDVLNETAEVMEAYRQNIKTKKWQQAILLLPISLNELKKQLPPALKLSGLKSEHIKHLIKMSSPCLFKNNLVWKTLKKKPKILFIGGHPIK